MESYLPDYCFSKTIIVHRFIVIHYFSCKFVQPENPFHLLSCQLLMHDLNAPKEKRMQFLKSVTDSDKRSYASAHAMIGRDGETLLLVPEANKAYHAGKSELNGLTNFNNFSYGIELIGHGTSGFTDQQYMSCARRCWAIMEKYNIPMANIVGHEEIAPGRKQDPGMATGNFDMPTLVACINECRL